LSISSWIQLIAAAMLPIGFIGLMIQRHTSGKSLGARVIQFIGVVMVLPVILILSLQGILKPDAVGTLIGPLVGYLLSGIASYDSRKPDAG
jgi:hypothetical protein